MKHPGTLSGWPVPARLELKEVPSLTRHLFRPTLFITVINLGSLLVSFVTQLTIASLFGAQARMDAYLAALLLPTVVNGVLLGSLGLVVIPFFIDYRSRVSPERAWHLTSSLINLAALVLGVLVMVGIAMRRQLLSLVVPGLDPVTSDLAAHLAMVLWPTLLLGGLSTLLILLCQAEEKFVWQAFVPLAAALLQLAIILLWGNRGIMTQAFAVLFGNAFQLVLLLPTISGRYKWRVPLWSSEIKRLAFLIIPVVGSRLFSDASGVVDRYVASLLVVGSIARLNYASRIPVLAVSLFSSAIAVTLFPSMSRSAAEDNMPELRRTFSTGTRFTWLFYIPIVVLMSVLAEPFVSTLLQRGRFLPSDTATVAVLLPWYMLSMLARALGNVSSRTLYAVKYVRIMSLLNVLSVLVYMALVFPLVHRVGIVGIPMSTAITDWLFYLVHCLLVWYGTGRFVERDIVTGIARITVAAVLSGAVTWGALKWSALPDPFQLIGGSLLGISVFGVVLALLRAPEIKSLRGMLRSHVAQFGIPLAR